MRDDPLDTFLPLLEQIETNEKYKALFRQHLIVSQQFDALLKTLTPEQQHIIHEYIRTLSLMRKYED